MDADEPRIVREKILLAEVAQLARLKFGDMVKAAVDVRRGIMAIGGELHADEESKLLAMGSKQSNLWGINIYPGVQSGDWIEFDSMINMRPTQNNRSRSVEDADIRRQIVEIVNKLVR